MKAKDTGSTSKKQPHVPKTMNRRSILKGAAAAATTLATAQTATAQQKKSSGLVQIGKRTSTRDSSLKQQATMDYERSLANYGGRLANPIRDLFYLRECQRKISS